MIWHYPPRNENERQDLYDMRMVSQWTRTVDFSSPRGPARLFIQARDGLRLRLRTPRYSAWQTSKALQRRLPFEFLIPTTAANSPLPTHRATSINGRTGRHPDLRKIMATGSSSADAGIRWMLKRQSVQPTGMSTYEIAEFRQVVRVGMWRSRFALSVDYIIYGGI